MNRSIQLLLCILPSLVFAESLLDEWREQYDDVTLIRQSDGANTWQLNTSGAPYFASLLEVPYRLQEIQEILRENANYPNWVPGIIHVEELEKSSDNSWLFYNVTNVPWPFKDRQSIIRMTQENDLQGAWKLSFRLGKYPGFQMEPNREVVADIDACWMVKPATEGHCEVGYVLRLDPGGNIPEIFRLPYIQHLPSKTVLALQDYLSEKHGASSVIETANMNINTH